VICSELLTHLGLPARDAYDLAGSAAAFPDGSRHRVEIPSVEGPEALQVVLDEARRRNVPVHRVSQGSGIFMQTDSEIRDMVALGAAHDVEVCLFVGPRASWDTGVQASSAAGRVIGGALRGADQLRYGTEDVCRAVDLGLRSVLVADLGHLMVLGRLKNSGALPADLQLKVSVSLPVTNPATAQVLQDLGATSLNLPVDLPVPVIGAIRRAVSVPLDVYIEAADDFGGVVRYYEIPDIVHVAAPVYLKFTVRNAPGTYPSGGHLRDTVLALARERVRRAEIGLTLLARYPSVPAEAESGGPESVFAAIGLTPGSHLADAAGLRTDPRRSPAARPDGPRMASVTFKQASRLFPGTAAPAVDRLDLEIQDGEFVVLVGPSGCGKSTSLRMLAGLEDVDSGQISIGNRDVTRVPARRRDIAMVFQNYALYPHMTVADNMGFALRIAGIPTQEIARRIDHASRILELAPYLDRTPKQLSGGQRQRVAMGRAIVREPAVFLMDEPLSNLDAKLRVSTRTQIASLQRSLGITTVYVTHDQVEAMTMGDRVAILKDGRLQQIDTPQTLYSRPANRFVAGFIGSPAMNLLDARVTAGGVTFGGAEVPLPRERLAALGDRDTVTLGLRPDGLAPAERGVAATVEVVEELGSDAYVYASVDGSGSVVTQARVVMRTSPGTAPERGAPIRLRLNATDVHLFDHDTGNRL
jgi:multiple sugar transport system ATP-binding protein